MDRRRLVRWNELAALVLVLTATLPGLMRAQQNDPASPLETWEDILPQRGGVVLWIGNPGRDSIRVDSLHVEACLNIRRGCGTRSLDLVLAPGAKKELARLEPAALNDPFSYHWFVDWQSLRGDAVKVVPRSSPGRSWVWKT
jgi:hypothetical protein